MKKKAPISILVPHANDKKETMAKVQERDCSPEGTRFMMALSYVERLGQAFLPATVLSPLTIWLLFTKGKRFLHFLLHTRVEDRLQPASTAPLPNSPVLPCVEVGSSMLRVGDCSCVMLERASQVRTLFSSLLYTYLKFFQSASPCIGCSLGLSLLCSKWGLKAFISSLLHRAVKEQRSRLKRHF